MLKKLFIPINSHYLLVILFKKNLNHKWCINSPTPTSKTNLLHLSFIPCDIKHHFLSLTTYEKL